EQIEAAVAIVVEERAAGPPARPRAARVLESRRLRHVLERSVAAVAIETVLAEVADEEIVVAVAIVVADARALAPAAGAEPGAGRDVLERAVTLVAIQMIGRRLVRRKSFERRAVDEEQVEPPVFVVVDERDAGAGGLEQIFVRVRSAEHREVVEAGFTRDV